MLGNCCRLLACATYKATPDKKRSILIGRSRLAVNVCEAFSACVWIMWQGMRLLSLALGLYGLEYIVLWLLAKIGPPLWGRHHQPDGTFRTLTFTRTHRRLLQQKMSEGEYVVQKTQTRNLWSCGKSFLPGECSPELGQNFYLNSICKWIFGTLEWRLKIFLSWNLFESGTN